MTISLTWSITGLGSCDDFGYQNVVNTIKYLCVGIDESGVEHLSSGSTPIPPPSGTFIPYQDLTQQEVLDWLWQYMGEEGKLSVEQSVLTQFEPAPISPPLPWSN
jgi:hypothetical protein